tara:strand:- start:89 stop:499 length:411 start_codon:yes stop_codon:yes gene_type:complete
MAEAIHNMTEIPNLITHLDLVNKIGDLTVQLLNIEKSYEELKQSTSTLSSDNVLLKDEANVFKAENTRFENEVKRLTKLEAGLRTDLSTIRSEKDKQLNDLKLSLKKKEKTIDDLKQMLDRVKVVKKKSLKGKVRA